MIKLGFVSCGNVTFSKVMDIAWLDLAVNP